MSPLHGEPLCGGERVLFAAGDYDTIARIYMQTGPSLWLFNQYAVWATTDKVHGFSLYPTFKNGYEFTWLSK